MKRLFEKPFAALAAFLISFIAVPVTSQTLQVPPPPVPDYVVFAGETIKFDRADLRERMDRELIAFTYSHNMSTLMIKRAQAAGFLCPVHEAAPHCPGIFAIGQRHCH